MKKCPYCGQTIRSPRSPEISRRFQAHVTFVTRQLQGQYPREWVYQRALLKAVEIDPPVGGAPYRYTVVEGVLYPIPTSDATNKEMMTACEGLHQLAAELEQQGAEIGVFPERKSGLEELEEEIV